MSVQPRAEELVDSYFALARAALPKTADPAQAAAMEEALADIRSQMLEELAAASSRTGEDARILADFGPPEELAEECAALAREESRPSALWVKASAFSGRALGLPYDLRLPSAERVASRWWNPLDPRVLTPRLFGAGWTINFAAVASRLGIVRPDDEEVPFALVPRRWLVLALALSLALAAATVAAVIACQPGLPAMVPSHFGLDGKADGFEAKAWAPVAPLAVTAFGAALVAASWLRGRSHLARVASCALCASLSALASGVYSQQAAAAGGVSILIAGLVASLVLPFALFIVLSRVGRHYERLRDYENEKASKEEREP
jgi:Predicted membrane protein